MADKKDTKYELKVPLDARELDEINTKQPIKVALLQQDQIIQSKTVNLNKSGTTDASFSLKDQPRGLRVIVGPGDAEDQELIGLQTLVYDVSANAWAGKRTLQLNPVKITPYYWYWWLRWCRTYTIRGRVICPDGSPVPGAEVCAYDVDHWFIWSSTQLIKCTTTAADGTFEIKFRWCCGWWPWYWLRQRVWQLNQPIAERIGSLLQKTPEIKLGKIQDRPSLSLLEPLLESEGMAITNQFEDAPQALDSLREPLLKKLPAIDELKLQIWPWYPWYPWWDCAPDVIFRVTQDCFGENKVIVDETIADTRNNISTSLDVTLISTEEACCISPPCPQPPCPEGDCVVVDRICNIAIDQIGGNQDPPIAPFGYYRPGAVPAGGANYHRPFAGTVPVYKAGTMVNIDYYEILDDALNPLPVGAETDFKRRYWDATTLSWGFESFNFQFMPGIPAGHRVVKTRERQEVDSGLTWDQPGADRFWGSANRDLLVPINSRIFADGTYGFKVRGWQVGPGGTLINPHMLPVCGTDEDSEFILTFDNRPAPSAIGHDASHNCGEGIHVCTLEPDCHIEAVRVNGNLVGICDTVSDTTGTLEIDFSVSDPDGHLAYYTLHSEYGLSSAENLLAAAKGGVLTPLNAGVEVGPRYGDALLQGAIEPNWHGGRIRLTIDLQEAFPEPCCYQLVLRVYKRTIVGGASGYAFGCNSNYPHRNRTKFTIGVGVCDNDGVMLARAATPVSTVANVAEFKED